MTAPPPVDRRALIATLLPMTALQAVVALGLFALATLAPQLGLSVERLGVLSTGLFALGALSAFGAGRLLRRLGGWGLASACAAAVALGLGALALGGADAAWLAVLCIGLAFGPETPASAALLGAVTPARLRPRVFSLRQTGNQIGAIAGSLCLPALWAVHPRLPFAVAALLAAGVAWWCRSTGRSGGPVAEIAVPLATTGPDPAIAAAGVRWATAPVQALALAVLVYSALQMSVNVFLLSHAVRQWGLDALAAAGWLAWLQAGGLVGRLAWGWLAPREGSSARWLGAIGLLAAGSGGLLIAQPALTQHGGTGIFAVLMAVLGLSASGWNGLLVAEVARIAGPARAGAWAGRMLGRGYLGLTAAPLLFGAAGGATTPVFAGLLAATAVAALALLWVRPVPTDVSAG